MAHLLAKLVYRGLTSGQAYLEAGLATLQNQSRSHSLQALHRLGFELTPIQKTA